MGHRWGFDSLIKSAPTPQSLINNQIPSFSGGAIQVETFINIYCFVHIDINVWIVKPCMTCITLHIHYIYINDVVIWHNDNNLITDTVQYSWQSQKMSVYETSQEGQKISQGGLWVPNSHNPHDTITGTGYTQSILPRFHLHKVGHRQHTAAIHWSAEFL